MLHKIAVLLLRCGVVLCVCREPKKLTPLFESTHALEEACEPVLSWLRGLFPKADLVRMRQDMERERDKMRVYVRMVRHEELMERLNWMTREERAQYEADAMWTKRRRATGREAGHWSKANVRIRVGHIETVRDGKAYHVCDIDNVFDAHTLPDEDFPERIEKFSDKVGDYLYRFKPYAFRIKWVPVGIDALKDGKGQKEAEVVIAAEDEETRAKWIKLIKVYMKEKGDEWTTLSRASKKQMQAKNYMSSFVAFNLICSL